MNTQEMLHDIHTIEEKTMSGLKDFQRATVERIDALFRNGQKRVLVADEVGLGKTLIAITNLPPRPMMGIESCGMLLSAVNNLKDSDEEELHLIMVDNHIPAGAKLY